MAATAGATSRTGKKSCVLIQGIYANQDGPGVFLQWIAAGCPYNGYKLNSVPAGKSKKAVAAEAKRRIANQPDADDWVLIIEP